MEDIIEMYDSCRYKVRQYLIDYGRILGNGEVESLELRSPGLIRVHMRRSFGTMAYIDVATENLEQYEVTTQV